MKRLRRIFAVGVVAIFALGGVSVAGPALGTDAGVSAQSPGSPIYGTSGYKWVDANMDCPRACNDDKYDCPCWVGNLPDGG